MDNDSIIKNGNIVIDTDLFHLIFNRTNIDDRFHRIVNLTLLSWNKFSSILMGIQFPSDDQLTLKTGMFYSGSSWLSPIANSTGLGIDQINFLVTCFATILIGFIFRILFPPHRVGGQVRGLLEAILGCFALLFCFGNQLRVLLLQAAVSYLLMVCIPCKRFAAITVTIWALMYLTAVHLCRLHYDYGGYTLDISGPIMIATQKLSSLAFNLLDGERIKERRELDAKGSLETLNNIDQNNTSAKHLIQKPKPLPKLTDEEEDNHVTIRIKNNSSFQPETILSQEPAKHHSKQASDSTNDFQSDECLISDDIAPIIVDPKDPLGSTDTKTPNMNGPMCASFVNKRGSFRNSLQALNPAQLPKILNALKSSPDYVDSMPESHKKHAVESIPNPLEFFAYMLYFEGAMVGPFIFYSDYRSYLSGYGNRRLPTVSIERFTRLLVQIIITGLLTAYVASKFPFELVNSHTFKMIPLWQKIIYSLTSLFLIRQKYYFAWSIGEAMNIAAGCGYSGVNPKTGQTEWAHVSNFDFFRIECGLGLKNVVDGWNISTTHWLREVFYDRVPGWCKTLAVFMISAFWHGFYPGYYAMFLTFAIFTFTSRIWRREMRKTIRVNETAGKFYDMFTTIVTHLAMNYAQIPFHLLELKNSAIYWLNYYFVPHIIAVVILIIGSLKNFLVGCCRKKRPRKPNSTIKPT